VQFFAFFGMVFLLLQYLQLVLGDTPLVAALSLIPMAAVLMPSARGIAPRLSTLIGVTRVCVLGLLLISVALVVLSRLDGESSYWLLLTGLVPLGAGMGLAMTPATAAITDALPPAKQGVGSAMNDLARELGGALGIAVMGSVLQSSYRSALDAPGLAAPVAEQARSSLAIASHLGASIRHQAQVAFTDGMEVAFLCAAVLVAITAAIVAGLQRSYADQGLEARAPQHETSAVSLPARTAAPRKDRS
jgi:MFS family permease